MAAVPSSSWHVLMTRRITSSRLSTVRLCGFPVPVNAATSVDPYAGLGVPPPAGRWDNCSQAEQHIVGWGAARTEGGQRGEARRPTDVSQTADGERAVARTRTLQSANMWQPASERLQVGCARVWNSPGRHAPAAVTATDSRRAVRGSSLREGETCWGFSLSYRCCFEDSHLAPVFYASGTNSGCSHNHFPCESVCSRRPVGERFKRTYSRYASATICIPVGLLMWISFKCEKLACFWTSWNGYFVPGGRFIQQHIFTPA